MTAGAICCESRHEMLQQFYGCLLQVCVFPEFFNVAYLFPNCNKQYRRLRRERFSSNPKPQLSVTYQFRTNQLSQFIHPLAQYILHNIYKIAAPHVCDKPISTDHRVGPSVHMLEHGQVLSVSHYRRNHGSHNMPTQGRDKIYPEQGSPEVSEMLLLLLEKAGSTSCSC